MNMNFIQEFILKHFKTVILLAAVFLLWMFSSSIIQSIKETMHLNRDQTTTIQHLNQSRDSVSYIVDSLYLQIDTLNVIYQLQLDSIEVLKNIYRNRLIDANRRHKIIENNDVNQDFKDIRKFMSTYRIK